MIDKISKSSQQLFTFFTCSAPAHRDPKLLFQRTDIFENTFYLQNKCIDWHSHVFIFYVMCTGSIKALFKVTFRPENWHPEFMKTSEGIKRESVCPLCLVILTTQSWPHCVYEKSFYKSMNTLKSLSCCSLSMLLISPLNMLFMARDVTESFATIDDVSGEMLRGDRARCGWEIDLGQTSLK